MQPAATPEKRCTCRRFVPEAGAVVESLQYNPMTKRMPDSLNEGNRASLYSHANDYSARSTLPLRRQRVQTFI